MSTPHELNMTGRNSSENSAIECNECFLLLLVFLPHLLWLYPLYICLKNVFSRLKFWIKNRHIRAITIRKDPLRKCPGVREPFYTLSSLGSHAFLHTTAAVLAYDGREIRVIRYPIDHKGDPISYIPGPHLHQEEMMNMAATISSCSQEHNWSSVNPTNSFSSPVTTSHRGNIEDRSGTVLAQKPQRESEVTTQRAHLLHKTMCPQDASYDTSRYYPFHIKTSAPQITTREHLMWDGIQARNIDLRPLRYYTRAVGPKSGPQVFDYGALHRPSATPGLPRLYLCKNEIPPRDFITGHSTTIRSYPSDYMRVHNAASPRATTGEK